MRGVPASMFKMTHRRRALAASVIASVLCASCGGGGSPPGSGGGSVSLSPPAAAPPGKIGHVFILVLEKHGYGATFTAKPVPSQYLARDLPQIGQLLTHYYGPGHASLDNYITMVS